MLYYLHLLSDWFSTLRIFRYITVRAIGGAGTAFLMAAFLAPWVIRQLRKFNVSQYERKDEAPPLYELHGRKEGTPTMGGILIIGATVLSNLLWSVPTNHLVQLALACLCYMGLIGFWDDYLKVTGKRSKGLSARRKLILQVLWVVVLVYALFAEPETAKYAAQLMAPFCKNPVIRDMGLVGTFVFAVFVMVGAANAVNLTDGLDGLAIGCCSSVTMSYMIMAYITGHAVFSKYLMMPHVVGSGELAVFCGCMLGASLGFLWYNCHPAHVFMGDTGSLALGGAIAMVAILIKQELTLVIVGGVFVMEAISVILQVLSFKMTGKRIFAMAPIHHHFELKKWSETQVTVRFWILSVIFALLGILTLKIR